MIFGTENQTTLLPKGTLPVPASSVPSESLFSSTGYSITDWKKPAIAINVRMLTFLKYYFRFIDLQNP